MRKNLFRIGTVLLLLVIAGVMLIVGRGYTIYFDNKTLEYQGHTCEAIRRINVLVNGEQVAKLSKKERGMATCMGQSFQFDIEVIREKDAEPEPYHFALSLPYQIDGIIVNLPAMMAGLPQEAWMTEFVPLPPAETEEEELPTDEFDLNGEV